MLGLYLHSPRTFSWRNVTGQGQPYFYLTYLLNRIEAISEGYLNFVP
jgi:hypothetical protein